MYNENTCTPTCEYNEKDGRAALSELLKKLNDLSSENLNLVTLIGDNLFGPKPKDNCTPMPPVDCMENAIKSILENACKTNELLLIIRERL